MKSFVDLFAVASDGHEPYPYQQRLAENGLPDLLEVPTGAGKTKAILAAWLWRRFFHPDPDVQEGTCHWLAYVLPMRVLVEQVADTARRLLEQLGMHAEVGLYTVMGGEGRAVNQWRTQPEQPAVFVGTQDMLLSRALNRAYGESRFVAPIDFGMFNSGVHWVFDEVQLMGAALPTSRQLEALRRSLGTARPSRTTWMSATVDLDRLVTVDLPTVDSHVTLGQDDRTGHLAARLDATRSVSHLDLEPASYPESLATALLERSEAGKRTIAVLNTVARATDVYRELSKIVGDGRPEVVLLHSRFRPGDRVAHLRRAVLDPIPLEGLIVVTTQVLEAGVDVTSTALFTEAAPWSSVVQRAGRCNRDGAEHSAHLLWAVPPAPAPYDEESLTASAEMLRGLEGESVTTAGLAAHAVQEASPTYAVLRRRDLIELFDNAPDLSGNEVDVGRFIRDVDDLNVQVAWMQVEADRPERGAPPPVREELCPVPIGEVRSLTTGRGARRAWRFDPRRRQWSRAFSADIRPGSVVVLDAEEGGYDPELGWSPGFRASVPDVAGVDEPDPYARIDDAIVDDHPTAATGTWVELESHLEDAGRACREILDAYPSMPGLIPGHVEAAVAAARLHDIGKAHPVFQATMVRAGGDVGPPGPGPWAKSPRLLSHDRRYFRHELVSALLLLRGGRALLRDVDPDLHDLVIYLVAAHHGKVRLAVRSFPDEDRPDKEAARFALGVWDGDAVPAFETPDGSMPSTTLDLDVVGLGATVDDGPSWTARALALRDASELGPFRLGFLEAIVRLADWRASAYAESRT